MPRFGASYADRYDEEIAFTDRHVGRLLAGLTARGLTDNLVVIVTSDHGEALDTKQDHGALNHSKHLYDELIHVPLMVKVPGAAPRQVTTPVSLVDVGPTVLDLYGLPTPASFLGQSLVPMLEGDDAPLTRPIATESGYLQRARSLMPKSAASLPWRLNQNYLEDTRDFRKRPVDDGVLRFSKRSAKAAA